MRFEWLLAGGVAGTRRNGRDRNSTSRRHRVWNAGREFGRPDFPSTGHPRGFATHLASTDCTRRTGSKSRAGSCKPSKCVRDRPMESNGL